MSHRRSQKGKFQLMDLSLTISVPAHRVVNRKGELSGRVHFATPTLMQERLEAEGVTVKDAKIVDFDNHYWHPRELDDE